MGEIEYVDVLCIIAFQNRPSISYNLWYVEKALPSGTARKVTPLCPAPVGLDPA
jgi:hypothetical protein